MLELPRDLTAETFLSRYWQKEPLFMPQAIATMRPAVSRNELAWLATLDDVESRIVFTDRDHGRYRVETGPFDTAFLQALPPRDWALLAHDVDKHLPAMRNLFKQVPFVPDWRIDDLMISFAVPGGGVGPHRDNYDVFLCQGIGIREWRFSTTNVVDNPAASDDLALLQKFVGDECHVTREGDVLYLPPGVAHWGIAKRACITYSIGMRAPAGYADPDLQLSEIRPGYLSPAALKRAATEASRFGCVVTELKEWLRPLAPQQEEVSKLLKSRSTLNRLRLHGMARLAFDESNVYLNGTGRTLRAEERESIALLCRHRRLSATIVSGLGDQCLRWLLGHGAFEIPENH